MESSSNKRDAEAARQAEIRKQIAALQAQLMDTTNIEAATAPTSPKRSHPPGSLLAPSTPPYKKRKISDGRVPAPAQRTKPRPSYPAQTTSKSHAMTVTSLVTAKGAVASGPAASTVLQKLASHKQETAHTPVTTFTRSSAFDERACALKAASSNFEGEVSGSVPPRDERLALVEDLLPGPYDHTPPFDDPHFEKLEPNSSIRLASRTTPHEDFQDYLRGRYYLSPSKLYSVIRLLPNKQGYDVPVEGDWVTIAVVAERGKLKQTQAPVGTGKDDTVKQEGDEQEDSLDLPDPAKQQQQNQQQFAGKRKRKEEEPKPRGKKYVNLKLIDFGCRAKSSASGGTSTIRGDAYLSLLLFESDSFDLVTREDGKKEKIYKGGSRGAFEKLSMLREGAVVALLNPKILKPFQRSQDAPHPTNNILALTPESVGSIAVIGYSQDLGMCKVLKRDGSVCGGWCDKRVAEVCEWHIQHAVERKRAGRPEFSMGTSGMSTAAKRKPAYDPARQWGLKPDPDPVGATYVVSGHIVSGGNKEMFVSESLGRDAQAKASRKCQKNQDRTLQTLLKRDKEGTKALSAAREHAAKMAKEKKGKDMQSVAKGKGKQLEEVESDDADAREEGSPKKPRKNAYSAQLIKSLGFDPTNKDGRRPVESNVKSKLDALSAIQAKRDISLAPRRAKKNSCVKAPTSSRLAMPLSFASTPSAASTPATSSVPATSSTPPTSLHSDSEDPLEFPDSDNELEKAEAAAFGKKNARQEKLVSLDDSEDELHIVPS